jgi:hypothetical protein
VGTIAQACVEACEKAPRVLAFVLFVMFSTAGHLLI